MFLTPNYILLYGAPTFRLWNVDNLQYYITRILVNFMLMWHV